MMETGPFDAYAIAILALAGAALLGLALSFLSVAKRTAKGGAPGVLPAPDYADPDYRWSRAYLNFVESMGMFVGALSAAILAGASPLWVNLFAAVFLLSRLAMAYVHVAGIGKPEGGARSLAFGVGWGMSILLALLAIAAAVF
jgi:uncharacterized MAPEG superfamily protein